MSANDGFSTRLDRVSEKIEYLKSTYSQSNEVYLEGASLKGLIHYLKELQTDVDALKALRH